MKLAQLSAGLIGLLAGLAGPDRLCIGERPGMAGTANADESGKKTGKETSKEAGNARRVSTMPMARDPSAAVAEEYEAARRKGTREALELFLARHGDDPLAEQVRAELKRLLR